MSVMVRCKNPDCQVSFSAPPLITDSVLHKRPETVGQEMATCPKCQRSNGYRPDDVISE